MQCITCQSAERVHHARHEARPARGFPIFFYPGKASTGPYPPEVMSWPGTGVGKHVPDVPNYTYVQPYVRPSPEAAACPAVSCLGTQQATPSFIRRRCCHAQYHNHATATTTTNASKRGPPGYPVAESPGKPRQRPGRGRVAAASRDARAGGEPTGQPAPWGLGWGRRGGSPTACMRARGRGRWARVNNNGVGVVVGVDADGRTDGDRHGRHRDARTEAARYGSDCSPAAVGPPRTHAAPRDLFRPTQGYGWTTSCAQRAQRHELRRRTMCSARGFCVVAS